MKIMQTQKKSIAGATRKSTGKIFFRQLTSADHARYKRVRLNSLKQYPNNFGTLYREELKAKCLKLDDAIRVPDQCNFVFGAFTRYSKLIGICGFITEKRSKTKHRGEIVQVFVDHKYTGQGIGKSLLQLSVDKAFDNEQIECITLSVVATNKKAVTLYKQMGFTEYGKLEKYFKSGDNYFTQLFLNLDKMDRRRIQIVIN